jgi:hypothetical protein
MFHLRLCYNKVFFFPEQHLRHVEKDVLIPKIMREKARERCSEQVQGKIEIFT